MYYITFIHDTAGDNNAPSAPHSRRNSIVWSCVWDMDVPLREVQFVDVPEGIEQISARSYYNGNLQSMCLTFL